MPAVAISVTAVCCSEDIEFLAVQTAFQKNLPNWSHCELHEQCHTVTFFRMMLFTKQKKIDKILKAR